MNGSEPVADPRRIAPVRIVCLAGGALVLVTTALAGGGTVSPFLLLMLAWALLPYAILWTLSRSVSDSWVLTGGGIALLLGELYIRAQVFLYPKGSTAPIALLFSPLYLTALVLPAGMGIGWLVGVAWRRSGLPGRGALVAAALTCGGFASIAVVRPDLLPYRLGQMVSATERIGPPRVVTGEGFLSKTRVSTRLAWFQVGEFDTTPGEDIAAIVSDAVILLDPGTGEEKERVALSPAARQQWNWFSRLVRDRKELLFVQTGGGYSEVEVLDLDGQRRWGFHPHPKLSPIALLPRDLDRDGRLEFYAASKDVVYRIDASGAVEWTRTVPNLVEALDARAGDEGQPRLVIGIASGGRVWMWDEAGRPVKELALPADDYRYALLDWPRGLSLVGGSRAVRAFDLDGRPLFEYALGDFSFSRAVTVRLAADEAPHLAVVAAAPRDVGLWRLLVFSAFGEVVYDEILPSGGATPLAATDSASQRQVLLLSGPTGLIAYRR